MNDRALIRAGMAGALIAAIYCATPLLAVGLPMAGLGVWLAGAGLLLLALTVAAFDLAAWGLHCRRAGAVACEITNDKEGKKP